MQVNGALGAASDPAAQVPQPPARAGDGPAPAKPTAADLALVIEDDKAAGAYVYKTVDRRTGEVIQQLPDEHVLRLRDAVAYAPGGLIRQSA